MYRKLLIAICNVSGVLAALWWLVGFPVVVFTLWVAGWTEGWKDPYFQLSIAVEVLLLIVFSLSGFMLRRLPSKWHARDV